MLSAAFAILLGGLFLVAVYRAGHDDGHRGGRRLGREEGRRLGREELASEIATEACEMATLIEDDWPEKAPEPPRRLN